MTGNNHDQARGTKRKKPMIILFITTLMGSCGQGQPPRNKLRSQTGEEFAINHRFTAYDCDHPSSVQAMRLPEHCLTSKTDTTDHNQTTHLLTTDKDPYHVLQKATYYEFDAHQCIQMRSKLFYTCVWASHSVLAGVPDTAHIVPPTIRVCRHAVRTQRYTTITGESVALNDNGLPTYIKEIVTGEISVKAGVVSCLGEEEKAQGVLYKQVVTMQETQFTIRKVKIRKNFDSEDLMIVETGTTIPANLVDTGGFIIDSGTYVLPPVETPCAYQIIKKFRGTGKPTKEPDELIITSQGGQIHLHTHGKILPPHRCPIQGSYLKTGHTNIVVFRQLEEPRTEEAHKFDNIDPRQVSIPSMIALKVEWALFQTSKKFGLVNDVSQHSECRALQQLTSGDQKQPELQGASDSLLYAKGEMLYNVKCPRLQARLDTTSTDTRCYKYLPVITGNPPTRRFLIPGSRLLSNVSEEEACDDAKRVPRGYLSTKGNWVALVPTEKVLSPPTELQLEVLTETDNYEKESKGGAYMERDLSEWARVFTWDTRRTITQTYEERISQSLGFARQYRDSLTREQFQDYINAIEAQATFMSLIDPILAYLTPKVLFLGSLCSLVICGCTGAMSIHGAYKYVQQSRAAKVTVSALTIAKMFCCTPLTVLTDDKFLRNHQAIAEQQLEAARVKKYEKMRKKSIRNLVVRKDEPIYEEFDPYVYEVVRKDKPSAPTDGNTTTLKEEVKPFMYPALTPPLDISNILDTPVTEPPPAYLRSDFVAKV